MAPQVVEYRHRALPVCVIFLACPRKVTKHKQAPARKSTILVFFCTPVHRSAQACTDVTSYHPLLLSQRSTLAL